MTQGQTTLDSWMSDIRRSVDALLEERPDLGNCGIARLRRDPERLELARPDVLPGGREVDLERLVQNFVRPVVSRLERRTRQAPFLIGG